MIGDSASRQGPTATPREPEMVPGAKAMITFRLPREDARVEQVVSQLGPIENFIRPGGWLVIALDFPDVGRAVELLMQAVPKRDLAASTSVARKTLKGLDKQIKRPNKRSRGRRWK